MRGDREYLHFTIERALRGNVALDADVLAIRLARSPRGVFKALVELERKGRVRREGSGVRDDPYRWQRCTLPMEAECR